MKIKTLAAALAAAVTWAGAAAAGEKITIGYFQNWPTANQAARVDKTYDKELGADVEWRAFANGNEMTQAMMSGAVQIAYSQGFAPFVAGATVGAPLKMVGVAVTYSENDLCVVRDDAKIGQANAKELEGRKVATPLGNVSHYKLLKMLAHLKVDASKVMLVEMSPADAAAALVRGDAVMGCAFGGALDRMREVGKPLMTGAELEKIGVYTFDIIAVTDSFAKDHPDQVRKFLAVTAAANAAYAADPDESHPTVAKAAGMDLGPTKASMKNFAFPTPGEQLGPNLMGGAIPAAAKEVAEVMAASGGLEKALPDYSKFIDASFLK